MSYSFLLNREPSDEELKTLTDAAIKNVKEKKEAAISAFKARLKHDLEQLKLKKLEHVE
ncbi:MAG: hypothetical protein GW843_09210 [Thiomicrospira sp.]|nr:hypothetical protein [Thiomicrospira sp.]NCN67928.1 hypothetical protein [Thiomicrospira sp.]NCO14538.1 hypothetical protein [Thiomicrospira sp.]NCO80727.1 hypothetical protein [Thiomicrospira sp.]NCP57934.1 hypothetical protein [Thiomicrospira sp.]